MKNTLVVAITLLAIGCTQQAPPPTATASPLALPTKSMEPELTGALQADVQLDKETYLPGDQIAVVAVATTLTDSAWVGVVPSSVPHGQEKDNDNNDLGYIYLKDNSRLILTAPTEAGEYDVRLNDDDENGHELASRSFKVTVDPKPVTEGKLLWIPDGTYDLNETVEVQFEAPLTYTENAWIGIVPTETEHGKESDSDAVNLGFQHLNGQSRGSVKLQLPATAGSYDVRMFDSDSDGKEVGSITFEVVAESE